MAINVEHKMNVAMDSLVQDLRSAVPSKCTHPLEIIKFDYLRMK